MRAILFVVVACGGAVEPNPDSGAPASDGGDAPSKDVMADVTCTQMCGSTCVDLSSDPVNCGECGKTCVKGCIKGMCVVAATVLVYPAGPYAMALDATSLYWTDMLGSAVKKVSKSGGTSVTLATTAGTPYGIAIDASWVYYSIAGIQPGIWRVGLNGGTPELLASQAAVSLAVDAQRIYWASAGTEVGYIPIGGGTPVVLATEQPDPLSIAVDSKGVYWANLMGPSAMKLPFDAGAPVAVGPADEAVQIAVDGTNIVWLSRGSVNGGYYDGSLRIAPIAGGSATTIVSNLNRPGSLAVDGTHAWVGGYSGELFRVTMTGTQRTTIASQLANPHAIVVDATDVYWGGYTDPKTNAIVKSPK